MAYTRNWDSTAPAGSGQVSAGDDSIRAMKEDLQERLESIFTDIDVDPLTLLPAVMAGAGAQVGRVLLFGPHGFEAVNDNDDTRHNTESFEFNASGLTGVGSIRLPHGATIQKIEAVMDKGVCANVTFELVKVAYLTAAQTIIDTVVRAAAGLGLSAGVILNPPGIGEVVDINTYHYVGRFTAGAFVPPLQGPRLYAVRITVDLDSTLEYI